ncbi:MAG: hypothetical protein Q9208_003188 [Pyrenodesmia sp. 3 TL-2023]
MSALRPFTTALESTEDSMDFYPDQNDCLSAEDGIDLDLDLTTDPPRSIDDDEMVEDPEVGMEQTAYSDAGPGHDEQMMDEIAGDDGLLRGITEDAPQEQDVDLDDIGYDELDEEVDVTAPVVECFSQSGQNFIDTASQSIMQQVSQSYTTVETQAQEPKAFGAARSNQGLLGQNPSHEAPANQDFPTSSVAGQSVPRKASNEGTSITRTRVDEVFQEKKQPLIEGISAESHGREVIPEEPQVIDPEVHLRSDRSTTSAEPSKKFTESSVKFHGAAPGLSLRHENHGANSSNDHNSLRQDSADPHPSCEELPAPTEGDLNKDSVTSAKMSYDPRQEVDVAASPQKKYNQEVDGHPRKFRVHAVVVTYQENDMFLFPPAAEEQDDDQTYFLTSETLADEPIQSLLKECRNVLQGSISQQEELEINIDDLGLRIFEVSRFLDGSPLKLADMGWQSDVDGGTTTLINILNLYLELYFNDSIETPPPMRMTLSTNVRFSQRLEYLARSVSEGKGISQLDDEDLSCQGGSLEDLQENETNEAAGEPSTGSPPGDANGVVTDGSQDHQSLSVEDRKAHLLSRESQYIVDASNGGVEREDIKDTSKSSIADAASLTDWKSLVNKGEGVSAANPLTTQPKHGLQENQSLEEQYDDEDRREGVEEVEVEEYDDRVGYDEAGNDNGQSSNGTSTIQGDDAGTLRVDAEIPRGTTASDTDPLSVEQSLTRPPSDEDLITYGSDGEDGDTGQLLSKETASTDVERSALEPSPPVTSKGALSYDVARAARVASDVLAVEDSKADRFIHNEPGLPRNDLDRAEGPSNPQDEIEGGQTWGSESYDHTDQVGPSNGSMAQELDQSLINLDDSKPERGASETAQRSSKSTEDEDEITFDEEDAEERMETENPVLASTDTAFEQVSSSNLGPLKRRWATDDDIPLPGTDSKRARSG